MEQMALFDYDGLSERVRTVIEQKTAEIRGLQKRTAENIIAMGNHLITVKSLLPEGQFTSWLKMEFDWSERSAQRLMSVALAFTPDKLAGVQIDPSALYVLSAPSTPEDVREKALDRAEAGERITHQKAQELVDERKEIEGQLAAAVSPAGEIVLLIGKERSA